MYKISNTSKLLYYTSPETPDRPFIIRESLTLDNKITNFCKLITFFVLLIYFLYKQGCPLQSNDLLSNPETDY